MAEINARGQRGTYCETCNVELTEINLSKHKGHQWSFSSNISSSPFKSTLSTKDDFINFRDYHSGDSVILCAIGAKLSELVEEQKVTNKLLADLLIVLDRG